MDSTAPAHKEPAAPSFKNRIKIFHAQHSVRISAGMFILGFSLDVLLLAAPDTLFAVVQQITYLAILSFLLFYETRRELALEPPPTLLRKIWPFHSALVHFLFGSLLSMYSLYFLKSSSLAASALFMLFIFGLLLVNELPQFRRFGIKSQWALLTTCVFCFFVTLLPILWGRIGLWPFAAAIVLTALCVLLLLTKLKKSVADVHTLKRVWPALLPLGIFALFYLAKLLPPVPMALMKAGVYHQIEKDSDSGHYLLFHERPTWKFWQSGDRYFKARPGSQIHLFAAIYSPTSIKDTVYMNWQRLEADGWRSWQRIQLPVKGGRKEGYRGFTVKANYAPGAWRVLIESSDAREIGRVRFDVELTDDPIDLKIYRY